jgi:membrane protein DedA with SNARE-associated domain/rhodanese-related sulfurtransferase
MSLLLELIHQYGALFVFACVLVEQAGAPVPAYPALLVAGSLAASGRHSAPLLLLAAVAACLVADSLWYLAGRRYGRRVLRGLCRFSLSPDGCVRQTESIFTRWGAPSLAVAKFVPGFASVATAMAGSTGVKRAPFLLFDALGAALWAGVGLALGWTFSAAVGDVLAVLAEMGRWGLMLLAVLLVAFVAAKAWRRRQFLAQLRMDRVSVHELAEMLQGEAPPLVLDVRSRESQQEGRIPGAVAFDHQDWPADLKASDEDAMVIVYCACPNDASAALVARKLMQRGFRRVRPLHGGIDAWRAAGLQLEQGEAPDEEQDEEQDRERDQVVPGA